MTRTKISSAAPPKLELNALQSQARAWLAEFPPDSPALVIPIFNALDYVVVCIESLAATIDSTVPVLLVDDASTDPNVASTLTDAARFGPQFGYFRKPFNSGFVGSVNFGFETAVRRDVVIVNSDTLYPPGWLERLRAAAYSGTTVATATPLTNHGSMVSVPFRDRPVEQIEGGYSVQEADARIQAASHRRYPLLPTAIGHCTYVRRSALDVLGFLDTAFAPGYGEEVDFSQRAVTMGFVHVAADDLFIFHAGAKSFSAEGQAKRKRIKDDHEALINKRYPWYRAWVADITLDPTSPLAEALDRAARSLRGHRIAIDATYLAPTTTGTSVVSLELIRALALLPERTEQMTVLVRDGWPAELQAELAQYVDAVRPISDFHDLAGPYFDLVFRPCQVNNAADLWCLRTIAHRYVIMQLDFIAYANPAYQRSYAEWKRYRHVTELAFAYADGIAFNSTDVFDDARRRGLDIPSGRTVIAHNGVDHHFHRDVARRPAGSDRLESRRFLFVLGTNFKHKNRAHAVRIFEQLLQQYDWAGHLVFAGPTVSIGGADAEESVALSECPRAAQRFLNIGVVDEAEKRWLLENAAVVLYPSTAEGFGLIPFEAALAGTPTLAAPVASLPEVLGDAVLYLPSEPAEAASHVWLVIQDSVAARRQVDAILARQVRFQWSDVAARIQRLWLDVLQQPMRSRQRLEQIDQIRDLVLPGAKAGHGVAKNWVERLQLAFHILRTEGPGALWAEAKQFIRWVVN